MNFGSNFNNRKIFTGESKSATHSVNMERFKERTGARSIDEVRNSRMKLNEQVSKNKYGCQNAMRETNTDKSDVSNNEKRFNHLEAMRNIKRGF